MSLILIMKHTIILNTLKEEVNTLSSYIIEGGNKLVGEVDISGSKNASLPIIAATILNRGITVIENIPHIRDVKMMYSILERLRLYYNKRKRQSYI